MADALKKVVSVLLQKGGVGKTAVTANTAFEAARMGLNVLFVDSDPTGYGSELLTNEGYLDGLVSGVLAVVAPPSALPACCSTVSAAAFRAVS